MPFKADREATHEVVQCLFTGHLATAFDHTIQSLWWWLHVIEGDVPWSPSNWLHDYIQRKIVNSNFGKNLGLGGGRGGGWSLEIQSFHFVHMVTNL